MTPQGVDMVDYLTLDDDKLLHRLFTEEDCLPREAADEFLKRSERMIKPLSDIVQEEMNWTKDRPEFWAPIHAVFILGAIGVQAAIPPLIMAIKWSDKYNVDWVFEAFPAIFGKIGMPAREGLRQLVQDKEQNWYVRTIALQGMAAITLKNPEIAGDIFSSIHSLAMNKEEDMDFRVQAANILLDFVCIEYKESLLAFCQEEKKFREEETFFFVSFDEGDLEKTFSQGKKRINLYKRDWLSFYDKEHIRDRQKRWERERNESSAREGDQWEEEEIVKPVVRSTSKIGRNEPCSCGSGKKYKKCCMGKDKTTPDM